MKATQDILTKCGMWTFYRLKFNLKKSVVFLEGWDGEGDGREVQEGRNICILMADLR